MENPQSDSKPTLHELLTNAVDLTDNRIGYINTVTVNANQLEVFVDLYLISPTADRKPQAQRVYKFVMPIAVAEDLKRVLTKVLDEREMLPSVTDNAEE